MLVGRPAPCFELILFARIALLCIYRGGMSFDQEKTGSGTWNGMVGSWSHTFIQHSVQLVLGDGHKTWQSARPKNDRKNALRVKKQSLSKIGGRWVGWGGWWPNFEVWGVVEWCEKIAQISLKDNWATRGFLDQKVWFMRWIKASAHTSLQSVQLVHICDGPSLPMDQ